MQIFDKSGGEEAHEAFVKWIRDHPDVYVVNERGNEPPMLHRASCGEIHASGSKGIRATCAA